ncbi:N-glycosylase/DNA lyase OGG1 [Physcomitrium patens]|uniref:DNA-(apurinic or apyrimidinic site) lyase n=1 Tax=Physcomitrium patens TaxID=3218 RepID=A0A2K1JCC4_PHYPA|nr:N-glycosylase/DNA lyase OGG1-like [Physcomitrium patens]PNR39182.1 hypothetical protein PHYPA_019460 [Physcomitrium patens]|eukprot:XP_024396718.1 N-glycosylase/DNA lyase OGG1-like [Physcomitrella patens]
MIRTAPPIPAPVPLPSGGGNAPQVCGRSMKASVAVPQRSLRRKRVLEPCEDDLGPFNVKSSAAKKLFSSRSSVDTLSSSTIKKVVENKVEVTSISKRLVSTSQCSEDLAQAYPKLAYSEEVESKFGGEGWKWCSLGVGRAELCLDFTLPTGQSFRWRRTGLSQYTGVLGAHLISLRQIADDVEFFHHASSCKANASGSDIEKDIREYLNLDTSLVVLYTEFSVADARFAAVAPFIAGARLLRQSPLECVFQFICSSNNHIQRITTMVDYLSSHGSFLGSVNGIRFHQFPSLEELAPISESQLRENGFGYRAKYIVGAVEMLRQKEGGEQWLMSLRRLSLEDAVTSLCTLPGIGPKVAACIALFSLDQHHAIPVDTHVWQIAVKYLLPELEGRKLTVKLHREVAEAFVQRFGKYAGWAHTVLFIAELSSQQNLLPAHLRVQKKQNAKTSK